MRAGYHRSVFCALYFDMMLDMLRGSDVNEALSRQKPWSTMTDDEKLVATLLFMVLFVAQLTFLVPLTLGLGLLWAGDRPMDAISRGPQLLLDFAPALTGVMFALLFFAWAPIRRSGPWIWVPGVLFDARFLLSKGVRNIPAELYKWLSGESFLEIVAHVAILACILYSLTMWVMNRRIKRGDSQGKPE